MKDSNKKPNKLIREQSPYLLQHAYNPVEWYPWGKEAFEKARVEDKPVFLSIGYSTCHWCHVMERETFEDETAARALNDGFVSIKVDREERPDIDHIYMDVCLAMTGGGGWPLSVFLDAEGRPFFAGTYFTNAQFMDLLGKIRDLWENGREKLSAASDSVQKFLDARTLQRSDASNGLADAAYSALEAGFDGEFGGFSDAPKFPSPHLLLFLMRYAAVRSQPRAMEMAAKTLQAMDRGGIHDHIGGGFCRYSTDRRWLAPHFEKMLYDNALLAYTYAQAYRQTGEAWFKKTAKSTFAYLERVMRSPSGGFYTAEDADSEGVEGKFYLWTKKEVEGLLGGGAGEFCRNFDITEAGNFEGKNIPNLIGNPLPLRDLPGFEKEREILFAEREKRVHPFLDDKVLSCWNGLCMAAFAFAGRTLEDPALTRTAGDIWRFIHKNMTDGRGGLLSSWREGEAKNPGHADDYAYVLWGLLELFAAGGDMEVLCEAVRLNGVFMDRFTDGESGALFFADKDAGKLIARTRTGVDGAVPSANSVQAANLFTLFALTGDLQYMSAAGKILSAFAGEAIKSPSAYAHMMSALLMRGAEETRVVVAGGTKKEMSALLTCARRAGALAVPVAADKDIPENLKEYFGAYAVQGGKSVAYVCRGRICLAPVTGADALAKLLEKQ